MTAKYPSVQPSQTSELIGRLQLLFALFLTCFAIQWVLLERLPKFPYLTVLDNVAYSALTLKGITLNIEFASW